MRIQLSLDQNTLRFYGDETSTLRVDSDDDIVFAFPVITTDFVTSGQLRVVQAGRLQQYPLVNSQASVPASTLVSGPFTISAVSNLYSTNELEFTAVVSYTGNEMSPIVNKVVHLNENQISIYNEDNSQYVHFIMARYYDGVDLSTKTCRVHWYSPDNNVADYDAVQDRAVVGDNIVFTWLIGNELTQYEGEIQFVVEFIGTDYVWKSKTCTFMVENSLADTGGLTPAPTDQWYNSFVVEMDGKVATAEAWATGQKSGTDVPDTDPAYHNNAKYYAEQAADEADRAEDAADHAEEVVDHKAEIDGYYQQMTVGNAEQLISSVTVNDKVPYNFRTSGGSIDIGNREVDKLVGGTVAWNQLIDPSTATKSANSVTLSESDGVWTFTTSAATEGMYFKPVQTKDHVRIMSVDIKTTTATDKIRFDLWGTFISYTAATTNWQNITKLVKLAGTGTTRFRVLDSRTSDWDAVQVKNPQFIDLTQMFGSTIADYIYSLETANAGAGVAWFKKLFPKPYYAYNAGQLMSVKTSAHQMVGFNQWTNDNLEIDDGANITINSDGTITVTNISYQERYNRFPVVNAPSKWHIEFDYEVVATPFAGQAFFGPTFWYTDGTSSYTAAPLTSVGYKGHVSSTSADNKTVESFRFGNWGYSGTVKVSNICLNLSWDGERDGEYEAYKKWTYPLDSDLELRGIPKLDSANNLYYDGDTYEYDGTVTRKYVEITYDGSDDENWTKFGSGSASAYAMAIIPSQAPFIDASHITFVSKPSELEPIPASATYGNYPKFISINGTKIVTGIDTITTVDAWRAYLANNPLTIVYELATPTTEEADPYQNPQIVDDFGTEEYVDERTVAIPVGHDTEYMNNLKAKLEMAPDSPDGDGDYIVRQTNGENSYVPLMKELPTLPSEDGTYLLKCTVSGSTKTLGWVEEE